MRRRGQPDVAQVDLGLTPAVQRQREGRLCSSHVQAGARPSGGGHVAHRLLQRSVTLPDVSEKRGDGAFRTGFDVPVSLGETARIPGIEPTSVGPPQRVSDRVGVAGGVREDVADGPFSQARWCRWIQPAFAVSAVQYLGECPMRSERAGAVHCEEMERVTVVG